MRYITCFHSFLIGLFLAYGPQFSAAANFTTMVVQPTGQDWNGTIWDPGATSPSAGNTYELLDNGTPFGNSLANTRVRNPAVAGLQTFLGDSLTLNTNTELRAKGPGAILNFPGVGGNPGLILNGGALNPGDDAVFVITGKVKVASTSYIVPGGNGVGAVAPLRGFNIAGQLSGSGQLVIFQGGTNVQQEISGASNSYSGEFVVKSGWLKGSGKDSLGTANITVDPKAAVNVDSGATPLEGPAYFEAGYDIGTTGKLALQNGGIMILHQICTFSAVTIEGTALSKGSHSYSELAAAFPNNFAPGGSGGLVVGAPAPHFTTKVTQASGQNWGGTIWDPGATAPIAGATYEALPNGTPFGNSLNNTRIRNPATAGVQTFPGDSLTLDANTELRAKQAGAILNFPGVAGLPGLILNGGVLNAGDDAVFGLTGSVMVASTSYIVPANNGGGGVLPLRGFNISAQLSGSGKLVIYQAGTNVAQEFSGTQNTYNGEFVLKAGWLKGSGSNSLGNASITIDPKVAVTVDASVIPVEGPALFEVNYDINSSGKLTVQNGGVMILHQKCTFDRASIEGAPLAKGTHSYAELAGLFPNSFAAGGSGSITVINGPGHFTTIVTQAAGQNWTAAIWDTGPVSPTAGNTYEAIDNGTPFGNAQSNTRIRNPAVAGVQTFPGDSLTLNTNTELRAKQAGAILNFPGVGNNPGLILNGGVLNAGDDGVFLITGNIRVVGTSFIVPADQGGGNVLPLRGINIGGRLSGSGSLVIYQAGTNVQQEISGNQNNYSGNIYLKAGWLKGSGNNSLGSGNITIDPLLVVNVDPSSTPAEGPAELELSYDIISPGTLTLTNGGMMILHQNCTFAEADIEGTTLTKGTHSYAELLAAFPANFPAGGSGSITIQSASAPAAPGNVTALNGDAKVALTWSGPVNATGYLINRGTTTGGPYTNVAAVSATNFVNTGLVNGTTYYYVIVATNSLGSSINSAQVIGRPNSSITGLIVSGAAGTATLSWTAFPGAVSYTVKRATTSGGPYTNVVSGITATNYTDTSLGSGVRYYYAVVAALAGGAESGISTESTALTAPSVPSLTAALFAATVTTVKATSTDSSVPQLVIEQSKDGTNFSALATLTNSVGITNTGLTLGTSYYYRAKAVNTTGASAYSAVARVNTPTFGVNVNFANDAVNGTPANNPAPIPPGYVQDVGAVYGVRGNGLSYGWDRDITTDGRWRQNAASPDLRWDTFMHLEKTPPSAIWEIQVPNGAYQVHIVSGDPTATDSVFEHNIEGVITSPYTPVSGAWWGEWTTNCIVADGRLTVTSGDDAANNKINFIDIYSISTNGPAPSFKPPVLASGSITISWSGNGKLQEATDVTGGWTDVAGNPQGTFTIKATDPRRFYRLVGP